MRGKGSGISTCEMCQERFRRPTGATPRFCGWECNVRARHAGMVRTRPKTRHGAIRVKPWTDAERDLIRREYLAAGPTALGRRLGRTKTAVQYQASMLGVSRQRVSQWSAGDEEWLRDHYGLYSWADLAKRLGRTPGSIKTKADRLGLRRRDSAEWTAADVAAIFGVAPTTVHAWLDRGWLRAEKIKHLGSGGSWQIKPEAVRLFVRERPGAFDIRKVDQISFIDLVLGLATERRGERHLHAVGEAAKVAAMEPRRAASAT